MTTIIAIALVVVAGVALIILSRRAARRSGKIEGELNAKNEAMEAAAKANAQFVKGMSKPLADNAITAWKHYKRVQEYSNNSASTLPSSKRHSSSSDEGSGGFS